MEPPHHLPIRPPRATPGCVVLCALLALMSGCTSTYRALQPGRPSLLAAPSPPAPTTTTDVWSHIFLFGFVRSIRTDVRDVCSSGRVESFRIGPTPLTTAVSLITLGLYTPVEQSYACMPPTSPTSVPAR
jgi:hypothetical protein